MSSITKHFNRTLFLSVLLIAVSQFNYGFDNQAFAQTQAMDSFDRQFGEYDASTGTYALSTQFESLLNGIPFLGFAVGMDITEQLRESGRTGSLTLPILGLIIGSLVSARYGRRMTMFCMSVYALISATVVITSKTRGQILAGRTLNCAYTDIANRRLSTSG